MVRIKNWEKSKKNKRSFKETRWDNTRSANSISVVYDGDVWRVWEFDVFGYEDEIGHHNGYNTQKEALKIARNYMRSHPNG